MLGADGADIGKHLLPRDFSAVGRRKTVFYPRATPSEDYLVLGREMLRGILRMGNNDRLDAFCERGVDQRKNLIAVQMGSGQHKIVSCDAVQHAPRLREHAPIVIHNRHRIAVHTMFTQFSLHARPLRGRRSWWQGSQVGLLVHGVEGWHPDDARPLARRNLDREGVHATDRSIQGNRSQDMDCGHHGTHKRRPFGGWHVVRFDYETGQASFLAAVSEVEISRCSSHHVGFGMNVQVIGATHQGLSTLGRLGRRLAGNSHVVLLLVGTALTLSRDGFCWRISALRRREPGVSAWRSQLAQDRDLLPPRRSPHAPGGKSEVVRAPGSCDTENVRSGTSASLAGAKPWRGSLYAEGPDGNAHSHRSTRVDHCYQDGAASQQQKRATLQHHPLSHSRRRGVPPVPPAPLAPPKFRWPQSQR